MEIRRILFIVLLLNFRVSFEAEIISTFMLSRHGARAPSGKVSDEYRRLGAKHPRDLTTVGKAQLFNLGKQFKRKYGKLKNYEVSFFSSKKERCIASMFSFIRGFMPNKRTSKHIMTDNFFHPRKNKEFNNEQLAFVKSKRKYIEKAYNKAKKYGLDEIMKKEKKKDVSGYFMKMRELKRQYTIYYCRKGNKLDISYYNDKLVKQLRRGLLLYYSTSFLHNNYVRKENHNFYLLLGKQIVLMLKEFDEHYLDTSYFEERFNSHISIRKGMLLFAHDRNVMGVIIGLLGKKTVFSNTFYMPKFASYITVDLISDYCKQPSYGAWNFLQLDRQFDIYVKITYQHREVYIKECGNTTCTVEEFLRFLDQNLDI